MSSSLRVGGSMILEGYILKYENTFRDVKKCIAHVQFAGNVEAL
jgi:hypothetical protein